MEYGKYIIVEHSGCQLPILFSSILEHSSFLDSFHKKSIISAGFFGVGSEPCDKDDKDIGVSVWGRSITLKLESRKEEAELIKKILRKPSPF